MPMPTDMQGIVVMRNEAGEYLALPQALVERGRVPEDQTAEAARFFDDAAGDVSGYVTAGLHALILSRMKHDTVADWVSNASGNFWFDYL